jgi:hypothetical protein
MSITLHKEYKQAWNTLRQLVNPVEALSHPITLEQQKKAYRSVKLAIELKQLLPPNQHKCQFCQTQAKLYHHDEGYTDDNILTVIPLCSSCHNKRHAELIKIAKGLEHKRV